MSEEETVGARKEAIARRRDQFAAKVRGARAILGWSQKELAEKVGLTQKSVYRIEQGSVDVRHSTAALLEDAFVGEGIHFEQLGYGGFRIVVSGQWAKGEEREEVR